MATTLSPNRFIAHIAEEKERLQNLLFIAHSELGQVMPNEDFSS